MMSPRSRFEQRLQAVDFGPILYKLIVADDGPRWSERQAIEVGEWYRRYHILFYLFPDRMIVPTTEIDEFWHHHILDTLKYVNDCTYLHGRFIHHFPYLGLRGDEDKGLLRSSFQETIALCESVFARSPLELYKQFPEDLASPEAVCGGGCVLAETDLPLERPALTPQRRLPI